MITGAGHHPNNGQGREYHADQEHEVNFIRTRGGQAEYSRHLMFPVLRRHQFFDRRQQGTFSLPPKLFLVSNGNISLPFGHHHDRQNDSYTVVFRAKDLQRLLWSNPSATPVQLNQCGDIADFEFYEEANALTATHGYRVFTVELGSATQEGTLTHTLRVADYKDETDSPGALHDWPRASRSPPPPPADEDGERSTVELSNANPNSEAFALSRSRDWSHDASRVSTDVFVSDGDQWSAQRIARPGVACDMKVPGNINMVGRVIIDDERAYISLYDSQSRTDGQGMHWRETKVSSVAWPKP